MAIVGAGPVGLSLALGLARQGVRSLLVERKTSTSRHSKAPVIHVRTREIFRQWGVEDRFVEAGTLKRALSLHSPRPGRRPLLSVDFSELDAEADRPGLLILEQAHTERLLLEAVWESGLCDVRFGAEAVRLTREETGDAGASLTVREHGGERAIHADFVVGCDGARSFVRRALGLPFEGSTYSLRPMLADVRVEDDRDSLPWPRTLNGPSGLTTGIRLGPGLWRIIRLEPGTAAEGDEGPEKQSPGREELGESRGGRRPADAPPVETVIRIGPGGHHDPPGSLRGLLGGKDGWILVRPDGHVAWARRSRDGLAEAARHALGSPV